MTHEYIIHVMNHKQTWETFTKRFKSLLHKHLTNCWTIGHILRQNSPLKAFIRLYMINWRTVKAKWGLSAGCNGIEKKQSLISIITRLQFLGKAESTGSPRCTGPKRCICSLMALKSCNKRHLPDFFLMTKMGVFHGEVDGSMCPKMNCSLTSWFTASSFSEVSGHWGTHTGVSVFHGMGRAAPVAPRKNPDPVYWY